MRAKPTVILPRVNQGPSLNVNQIENRFYELANTIMDLDILTMTYIEYEPTYPIKKAQISMVVQASILDSTKYMAQLLKEAHEEIKGISLSSYEAISPSEGLYLVKLTFNNLSNSENQKKLYNIITYIP